MIFNTTNKPEVTALIAAWQQYVDGLDDWQELVQGLTPKKGYCGPIYEPTSPLERPNESFAIADMREIKVAEPHYHTNDEVEIYFVVSGSGLTVLGGKELEITAGDVIVTPTNTAHFTVPQHDLVLIVINTPPFNPENSVHLDVSNPDVGYDHEQYLRLLEG